MPTDPVAEREAVELQRARSLLTKKRQAEERRSRLAPTVAIATLTLVGLALSAAYDRDGDPAAIRTATCDPGDSACLGARILSQIQAPCSRAIEGQLKHSPEWMDSAWERRFSAPAWHKPPDQLIFYGNRIKVKNSLGMQLSPSYFCVVKRDGTVVRAELRDAP